MGLNPHENVVYSIFILRFLYHLMILLSEKVVVQVLGTSETLMCKLHRM